MAGNDANDLYNASMESSSRGGITQTGSSPNYTYAVKADSIGNGPGGADGDDYTYGDKPVVWVSFFDAMRFTNWLENGQPTGPQGPSTTEEGVYAISDGLSETRAEDATYFIPSEDEWYKAAYHEATAGTAGIYFDYPTGTDAVPNNNLPSADTGNSANFWDDYSYTTGDPNYPGNDDEGRTLQRKRDTEKMTQDFITAAELPLAHERSSGKVGVVGFCFGGGMANAIAVRIPDVVVAAVPFYGRQPAVEDVPKIKASLLLHYAEFDKRINAGWPAYEEALKSA